MKRFLFLAVVIPFVASGCGKPSPKETSENAPSAPSSTVNQVVEDVVGYTTIKEGRRAKAKIEEAAAKQQDALKEVMEQ